MLNKLDIIELFNSASDIDDLWAKMRACLDNYGVSSVFYGVGENLQAKHRLGQESIIEAIWYKTDHPRAYCEHYDNKRYVDDDLGAIHAVLHTSPFIWHNRAQWGKPTSRQRNFMLESYDFRMGVGITLPLRFNYCGIGGLGMCTANMSESEFNAMWQVHETTICTIGYLFDECMRKDNNIAEIYPLSPREVEVLNWLACGITAKVIAYKLNTTLSTVDKQIRSARQKLGASNNEQAVIRALAFGLISP